MVWQMCHVSLRNRKPSEELRNRLGIVSAIDVLRQIRLRWVGHVVRMGKKTLDDQRGKGRPCKTWSGMIKADLINWDCSQDWHKIDRPGEKPSEKPYPTHASMEMDVK